MKTVLIFIGIFVLLVIIPRMIIHIIFQAVYKKKNKKINKYRAQAKEKFAKESERAHYNTLHDTDLINTYRKLLKEGSRKKDLKKAAEISYRLDMIEEIMLKRGIEIPRY